jgi:phosphoglucosamine mutase
VRQAVLTDGADLGVAHDGDADRLVAVSHLGGIVDGDALLAILARQAHLQGASLDSTVVTTVMTNLGFHHAMRDLGIDVVTTPVGDRYVLETMRERGLNLGGEQSGHLIDLDHATTGDGVLAALKVLEIIRTTGSSLAELATVMERLPQVLVNVPDVDRDASPGPRRSPRPSRPPRRGSARTAACSCVPPAPSRSSASWSRRRSRRSPRRSRPASPRS